MKRLATFLYPLPPYVPLILFRWLLWAIALAGLVGDLMKQRILLAPMLAATVYATGYLVLWSMLVPRLNKRSSHTAALLGSDLVLSLGAAWLAGKSGFTMTPFVVGALVLPGAFGGWPAGAAAIFLYAASDLFLRLLHTPPTIVWHQQAIAYTEAAIAASIWPLSVLLHSNRRMRTAARQQPTLQLMQQHVHPAHGLVERLERPLAEHIGPEQPSAMKGQEYPPAALLAVRVARVHGAVRQVIADARQQGMEIALIIEGSEPDLPSGCTQVVARALDVALENVRRHAKTNEAAVHLFSNGGMLHLTVRDHGSGLFDGTTELPGFHRLKLVRYLLQEVGGSLHITEPDDEGVLLEVVLPMEA
ncbi:MAG: ATP-binding protein [Herpetosiphon sp.]